MSIGFYTNLAACSYGFPARIYPVGQSRFFSAIGYRGVEVWRRIGGVNSRRTSATERGNDCLIERLVGVCNADELTNLLND